MLDVTRIFIKIYKRDNCIMYAMRFQFEIFFVIPMIISRAILTYFCQGSMAIALVGTTKFYTISFKL